jgi:hypothetical protein
MELLSNDVGWGSNNPSLAFGSHSPGAGSVTAADVPDSTWFGFRGDVYCCTRRMYPIMSMLHTCASTIGILYTRGVVRPSAVNNEYLRDYVRPLHSMYM